MKDIYNKIISKLEKGDSNSPFLFVWQNLEILNSKVFTLANDLLNKYNIPNINLFVLNDIEPNIKLAEIKHFLKPNQTIPNYKFQIFIIENFSRMTTASSNSCLKFFEEPWIHNIIFITNKWESGILDTILSRVDKIYIWWINIWIKDEFLYLLIEKSQIWNNEIISYFFRNKLEKEEYIRFLKNIIIYSKEKLCFIEYLEELNSDIEAILKNNANARAIVDKWILRLMD